MEKNRGVGFGILVHTSQNLQLEAYRDDRENLEPIISAIRNHYWSFLSLSLSLSLSLCLCVHLLSISLCRPSPSLSLSLSSLSLSLSIDSFKFNLTTALRGTNPPSALQKTSASMGICKNIQFKECATKVLAPPSP